MASVALTENVALAPAGPAASTRRACGTDTVGGIVSTSSTLTAKVPVDVFVPSLAEHETVVVPMPNVEPDSGEQLGLIDSATASVAVTGP
jgi:hypothetical protein